jgi:hypothetical protein
MKKNLIFKLCFIVGIFLIILTACDLGTNNKIKRANLTFSLEGPVIEQVRANSRASNSARYIHPNANYLIFELFSGEKRLDTQTISIKSGTKSISITVKGVPLNDPNLRAEIKVWGNGPTQGADLLGQNSIHLGRIGLGYTKLTLGVKPESGANVAYVGVQVGEDEDPNIYLETYGTYADTFNIQMFDKKGLYTISDYNSANIYLYDSDGKNYQNSFFIDDDVYGQKTRVFYHPEDKASTYYAYFESQGGVLPVGWKLEQDILITKENGRSIEILYEEYLVEFNNADDKNSFTIYNPYPFTLNLEYKIDNADEEGVNPDSKDKFKFTDFPEVLLPGKSKEFTVNFHDPDFDSTTYTTYSVKSTISAPGLKDFVLHFTGTSSGT